MELENMPSGTRPESEIMFTTHYTGAFDSPSILNRKYYTCKWKGPRNGWVCINNELVDGFDRFDFPWPLKKIGYNPECNTTWYVRTDSYTWWWSYLKLIFRNRWIHVKMRIIMTLMVWGLAYIPHGEIVGWYQVGRKKWKERMK